MATVSPASDFAPVAASAAAPAARVRDPRLDFYRGIAMFIILIAHIPNDPMGQMDSRARFGYLGRDRDLRVLLGHGFGHRLWRRVPAQGLVDGDSPRGVPHLAGLLGAYLSCSSSWP